MNIHNKSIDLLSTKVYSFGPRLLPPRAEGHIIMHILLCIYNVAAHTYSHAVYVCMF